MLRKNIIVYIFLITNSVIKSNEQQIENAFQDQEQLQNNFDECKKTQSDALLLCIKKLTLNEQKRLVKELTPQQRTSFLSQLTLEDYDEFLDNYNEYEWARLYNHLTEEEQSHWPKSIHEQRNALSDIKNHAQYGNERYQTFTFIVDIFPYGQQARENLEKAICDDTPLPLKIKRMFTEYMKKKFKI